MDNISCGVFGVHLDPRLDGGVVSISVSQCAPHGLSAGVAEHRCHNEHLFGSGDDPHCFYEVDEEQVRPSFLCVDFIILHTSITLPNNEAMKKLNLDILINASPEKVWDCIIDPVKYRKWASAFMEGCYFEGGWNKGDSIQFLAVNEAGVTEGCLLYTSPSPRDRTRSRMPSSA